MSDTHGDKCQSCGQPVDAECGCSDEEGVIENDAVSRANQSEAAKPFRYAWRPKGTDTDTWIFKDYKPTDPENWEVLAVYTEQPAGDVAPWEDDLRERRVSAGLSLRATADRLGVTATYLGEVERGRRQMTKAERIKLDNILAARPKQGLPVGQEPPVSTGGTATERSGP